MARKRSTEPKATLAEVAVAAGVSTITASRALRGLGPMTPATRAAVEAAAAELGYRRNPLAASLVTARSNLIAVIAPALSNIVFVDVLAGLAEVTAPEGYRTISGVSDYDPAVEAELVASLLSWRPAALVLTGVDHDPATAAALRAGQTTVIEIMDLSADPIDRQIGFSHQAAGVMAAEHLWRRGYRRIGYVGHDLTRDPRAARRRAGFAAALAGAGGAIAAEALSGAASSVAGGRLALADLLARAPDLDAVWFSNDDMALGGVFHCLAAGIDMPGDLALMGFNGLDIGQALPRPLTTILTPRVGIGRLAGRMALDLAAGTQPPQVQEVALHLLPGATA